MAEPAAPCEDAFVSVEVRAVVGIDQLERWVAVHNEVRPDDPQTAGAKALVRAEEADHLDLLAYIDDRPVGAALLAGNPEGEHSQRVWMQVEVLPAYRGRGVGTALLRAVSDHARRRGHTTLACHSQVDDAYSLSFLERRGFVAQRRWDELVLELPDTTVHRPTPPDGVAIISLAERPALLAGMYEVATETYHEMGGHMPLQASSLVKWQAHELGPGTRLELTPVAVAGEGSENVIGFATLLAQDEASAEVRMVTVRPTWRRRGVASALLAAQIEGASAQGLRRLCIWIPEHHPADLYTKLGFERRLRFVILDGPLL
jgi:GNAT superfamily N-acetyltransferase